jgi:hypothetical protein
MLSNTNRYFCYHNGKIKIMRKDSIYRITTAKDIQGIYRGSCIS